MKAFIKVMKALSDPNRVRIIKMLQHKMMCVCEIQKALQVSQPAVSIGQFPERRALGELSPYRRKRESICGQPFRKSQTLDGG